MGHATIPSQLSASTSDALEETEMHATARLCSWIEPLVQTVIESSEFGMLNATICDLKSGKPSNVGLDGHCDRFKLKLPYAENILVWMVIFKGSDPSMPPDFQFDDDNFEPETNNLVYLNDWNSKDPTIFKNLLLELLSEYRKYQLTAMEEFQRLQFELEVIQQDTSTLECADFLLLPSGCAFFVFELHLNLLAVLPPHLLKRVPGFDTVVLKISVPDRGESGQMSSELLYTEELEMVLSEKLLSIPALRNDSSETINDYKNHVEELLNDNVKIFAFAYQKRKECLSALCVAWKTELIEVDQQSFFNIAALMDLNDFKFFAKVSFSAEFLLRDAVKHYCIVELTSVYHDTNDDGLPYTNYKKINLSDFSEDGQTFVQIVTDAVNQMVPEFQKESVRIGK